MPADTQSEKPAAATEPPVVKTVAATASSTVNKLEWNDSVCKLLITFRAAEIGTADKRR